MQKSQLINGVIIDWNKIDRESYLRDIPALSGIHNTKTGSLKATRSLILPD